MEPEQVEASLFPRRCCRRGRRAEAGVSDGCDRADALYQAAGRDRAGSSDELSRRGARQHFVAYAAALAVMTSTASSLVALGPLARALA